METKTSNIASYSARYGEKLIDPHWISLRRPSRKALKPYLLAVEIASRFTGETSSSEVTCEERSKLTEKYGVDRDLISNVLSGLRSVGVYRDKYYQQKHTSQ